VQIVVAYDDNHDPPVLEHLELLPHRIGGMAAARHGYDLEKRAALDFSGKSSENGLERSAAPRPGWPGNVTVENRLPCGPAGVETN
jgi:hypothetical protein